MLADADHVTDAVLAAAADRGVTLLAPVCDDRPGVPRTSPAAQAWRARMATTAARDAYRERKGLSELSNAHLLERLALRRLPVRGLAKVTCVVLLAASVANILAHAATFARPPPPRAAPARGAPS